MSRGQWSLRLIQVPSLVALLFTILGLSCRKPKPPVPTIAATDPLDACLDAQTKAAGLNAYGDPADTNYGGGTPLFDETTGRSVTRLDYIARNHPDLAARCRRAP